MGRTLRFNSGANNFVQGNARNNIEISVFMLDGNDTVLLNRTDDFGGRNRVDAGNGNDTVRSLHEDGNVIVLGTGADVYFGEGFGSFSSERADTVRGGAGDDIFSVSTVKSLYFGDDGADTFRSTGERNDFVGGAGTDSISYQLRAASEGGVTIDLQSGLVQTGALTTESLQSIENARGSVSDDTIFGSNGANRLRGAQGDDTLIGRGGADVFEFSSRADSVFTSTTGDVVMDFNRSQGDRIDLSGMDAVTTASGNQAFTFIGGASFSNRAGQLRYSNRQDLGDLDGDGDVDFVRVLGGDVNGDGRSDFGIRLFNFGTLNAADLVL